MTPKYPKVHAHARRMYWALRRMRASAPAWKTVEDGPLKGLQLYLSKDAQWAEQMAEGHYDTFIYDALASRDLGGQTLWDVGAHIGYHVLGFARLAGSSGCVHAFEPNKFNCERLRLHSEKNQEIRARVVVHGAALSSSEGEMEFVSSTSIDSGQSSGSHLRSADAPLAKYEGFYEDRVRTLRGDALVEAGASAPPAVIKIDVEGAEMEVLQGCSEILAKHRPLLLIEVHTIVLMLRVQQFLFDHGYQVSLLNCDPLEKSRCFVMAVPR